MVLDWLVGSRCIKSFFEDPNRRHYHGVPNTDGYKGLHAMALVGHRQKNGLQYFLLQNWWKTKQFIEVDTDYLERSGATVYFVKTPQTQIPNTFPTHSGRYFELDILFDIAERLPYEY